MGNFDVNNNNEKSGNFSKKGKNKSNGGSSSNTINNPEKPKQPQRGLGVAQLEKIRMHTQMLNSGILPYPFINPAFPHIPDEMGYQLGYNQTVLPPPAYGYPSPSVPQPPAYGYPHPNSFMTGIGNPMERANNNIRYSESQPCNTAGLNPNNNFRVAGEDQAYPQQPGMVTRHLLSQVEQQDGRNSSFDSMIASSSQNTEPKEDEDLDLELKL